MLLSKENKDRISNVIELERRNSLNYSTFVEFFTENEYDDILSFSLDFGNFISKNDNDLEKKIKYFLFHREDSFDNFFTDEQVIYLLKNNLHLNPEIKNKIGLYIILATRFPNLANKEFLFNSVLECSINGDLSKDMMLNKIEDDDFHYNVVSRVLDHIIGGKRYEGYYINISLLTSYLNKIDIGLKVFKLLLDRNVLDIITDRLSFKRDTLEYIFEEILFFSKKKLIRLNSVINSPYFDVSFLLSMNTDHLHKICVYGDSIVFDSENNNSYVTLLYVALTSLNSSNRISLEEFYEYICEKESSLNRLNLAKSKNINDLVKAASDEKITKEVISILKKSKNKQVLDALLDNPNVLLSDLF